MTGGAAARDFDSSCPFCPGNEAMLPKILKEIPGSEPPGWRVRVVPNKYPAVVNAMTLPSHAEDRADRHGGRSLVGHGHQEVIIETPHHGADLATLSADEVGCIMQVCRTRYADLAARPAIRFATVFRNHGGEAGASLPHPHSQVMATALMPPQCLAAAAWAQAHYDDSGRCATCDHIAGELADGRRALDLTERFVALVPFAAASPFEQWILPRRHQSSFADADDEELMGLGWVLRRAIRRLNAVLDNPPYNYAIESVTMADPRASVAHWRLRLVPDIVRPGGFELASGMRINPSLPEDDAKKLRAANPLPE